MIAEGQSLFKGEAKRDILKKKNETYETEIRYLSLIDNPVQDWRQVGPLKIDRCGNVTGLGDQSVNGLFPKGDANKVLSMQAEPCP
jgi:hypothetical protein